MSFIIGYAKNLFQRGPGVPGRVKSLSIVPLYHRPPSGLALFAPVLIAMDLMIIGNTVNVTWRNWKTESGQVLRPLWMRVGVCSLEIATGAILAASLLIYRSRTATMLSILPPKKPNVAPTASNRRIFLQSANSWRSNGTIFPLSACTLTRVEEKVLFLEVNGQYSGWQFNLDNSIVDGQPLTSPENACKTLATAWHGAGGKGIILTSTTT
ncbi:hypothetical protein B0H19DRAFT_19620 [Mycena capillaripes]|nr:hypothetical protein B0H19DRAFT_19620 [Mycena capillaripes]